MSLLKTKKDKELFEKWNKKLEKYDDCNAEDFSKSDVPLKRWARWFTALDPKKYDETNTYFEVARSVLHTHKFKSSWHRKIWELHSEGFSYREISKQINSRFSFYTVGCMIRQVKKEVGINDG